jgi:hypothetical protein
LDDPQAMFAGLIGSVPNEYWKPEQNYRDWPECARSSVCIGNDDSGFFFRNYNSLSDGVSLKIPIVSLDVFCSTVGISPNALTIDVEGAELQVLEGADRILSGKHIPVWVSIHPDQVGKFGDTVDGIQEFMEARGYSGTLLEIAHEEHWLFE